MHSAGGDAPPIEKVFKEVIEFAKAPLKLILYKKCNILLIKCGMQAVTVNLVPGSIFRKESFQRRMEVPVDCEGFFCCLQMQYRFFNMRSRWLSIR